MWHADKGWRSVGSWWKVLVLTIRWVMINVKPQNIMSGARLNWNGTGLLWFYLAFTTMVFYAAVPLAGLSLEPATSLQMGSRPIWVSGLGVDHQYIMASHHHIRTQSEGEYNSVWNSPIKVPLQGGEIELIMWQRHLNVSGYSWDDSTLDFLFRDRQYIQTSVDQNNYTWHGYGIRRDVNSSVGTAHHSPTTNTFSPFNQTSSSENEGRPNFILIGLKDQEWPGVHSI